MENGIAPRIVLVYFDAGGGHRAAALALKDVLLRGERPWRVELMNLQELLDTIDPIQRIFHVRLADLYNRTFSAGWTLGGPTLLKGLHATIAFHRRKIVRRLQQYWSAAAPQLVVSVIPNFNACLAESLSTTLPGTPFVTVLTDLADYPPHFWMERESEYIVCGSDRAYQQARSLGHAHEAISRVSGMILDPKFYQAVEEDHLRFRQELDLDPALPTVLVMFGGHASRDILAVAEGLHGAASPLQAIFICGRNERLLEALRKRRLRYRSAILGFTQEMPRFMAHSDFMIGKPGPGSISEAVHMRLPVIVNCNSWTLPQERYNAAWVEEAGVGICVRNFRQVAVAVDRMIRDLPAYQAATAAFENRAIFEVAEFVERVLRRGSAIPAVVV